VSSDFDIVDKMRTLSQVDFNAIVLQIGIKPRLIKDLKFARSTSHLSAGWSDIELLAIEDRTGDEGVLLIQPEDKLYAVQYELSRRIVDSRTGRDRAIICDFCYTWQPGSGAASITFTHASKKHSVRFLCCADLACSGHARTVTKAVVVSRAHLKESILNDERVARLKTRLIEKINDLRLEAV